MKTIAEILAIRDKMQSKLGTRDGLEADDTRIVVGMATCGIAAGARPVLNAFVQEITTRGLKNVKVTQTGCLGMCRLEPMVQISAPGKETVTYVNITEDIAKQIVVDHIVNGNIVAKYTIDKE